MDPPHETPDKPPLRSATRALGLGVAVGLAVAAVGFALVAMPIYVLAQSDPDSLDRPVVRDALFRLGLPFGLIVGTAVGVVIGLWYRRGGQFPTDRSPW